MPVTVKDISKKAEVSYSLGIITHCLADPLHNKVQGGFKYMAHTLMIGDSFFPFAQVNKAGKFIPSAVILRHEAEVLLHAIHHDDLNATRVAVAFT